MPSELQRAFLWVCLVLVAALFLLILSPFLTPILLAIVVVTLFYPLHRRLNGKLKGRSNWASLCMCVLVTFLIIIPTFLLGVTLANETQRALREHQQTLEQGLFNLAGNETLLALWNRVTAALDLPGGDMASAAQAFIRQAGMFLVRNSSAILAGFATLVADFFIMMFTLFFLFRDGEKFLNEILQLVPLEQSHKRQMVSRFKETIVATFFGSFITAGAQGVATGLMLWILGFHNALLWGTLAAFTSLIPIVGAGLVWVPASLYLLLQGGWVRALILAAYGTLIVSLLDNILRPMVIRRASKDVHTLLIFFGILGGVAIFGFSGLILGPLIVAFTVAIVEIVKLDLAESAQ
ncbi:MAG: AI-2E family transporter [Acidobacteria bacterium]|nr:AI-2E family transporter [Acidobacteriota bacterium]